MTTTEKQTHEEYMLEAFGLHPGDEYSRGEWDLDGNPIRCFYVVGKPYDCIRAEPVPVKRYA